MRWVVVLVVMLVGTALADVQTLPAKHANELRRKIAQRKDVDRPDTAAIAARLLVPSTCVLRNEIDGVKVFVCKKRSCGQCTLIEATAQVRLNKSGVLTVRDVLVLNKGDTGQCGDCM